MIKGYTTIAIMLSNIQDTSKYNNTYYLKLIIKFSDYQVKKYKNIDRIIILKDILKKELIEYNEEEIIFENGSNFLEIIIYKYDIIIKYINLLSNIQSKIIKKTINFFLIDIKDNFYDDILINIHKQKCRWDFNELKKLWILLTIRKNF